VDNHFIALVAGRECMMAVSVLYISYDGMTDPLGQSQVIPYLIGLTKRGYSFTLLSCEKEVNFQNNKAKIEKLLSAYPIDWQPLSYTKNPPVLSSMYDVSRLKRKAIELHQKNRFSIIHCRSYIASLVGLEMKYRFRVKFIFDMRGLWADERVDGKLWNLKNPLYKMVYRYFKRKEKQFLENADYTVSLTHNAKNEILSWKHLDKNRVKMEVIPCCVDLNLFNTKQIQKDRQAQFMQELKLRPEDYVLLYLGSIGTWYMLDEMLEFFRKLKDKKPHAKFLFVTKDEQERILQTADKYGVKDAIILRPGAREEIPYLISICSSSIFFILPSYSKKASSPTKQGEIMAMGKPIVCNTNVGDTDKIVRDYHSGVLVTDFTPAAYGTAIREMDGNFNSAGILNGAQDYFSLEQGVGKYAAIYAAVLA
jgi:glycosyltransferase involved in cell wall biosynthesis